jgi:excinuclease ABC subunit A
VRVRGAREHNLKNVDVDIPRDALVVFTGVSGSGKSSLAFGTLYAEAQRRYLESVAPYARRLIDQAGVPEVDAIDGLPPAVALQQQRGSPQARSSVGSVTTISSLLRMLYSRAGRYPADQPMLYAEDFSPNTAQGACPRCHGLGRVYEATEASMVPDASRTIRDRAVAAWPPAWHGQNLRDILTTLGHDVDIPWRELPRATRDWILFTDEQPTVPVHAGLDRAGVQAAIRAKRPPSYMGTFTSARRYLLQAFATTESASIKKRVAQHLVAGDCPACGGKRLTQAALSVTFAGLDIAELSALPLDRLAEVLRPAAEGRPDDESDVAPAARRPHGADGSDGAAQPRDGGGDDRAGAAAGGVLDRAASRADTARRVAAGGSAHAAAPDVRRTPDGSPEKRLAARRIAQDLTARLATLAELGLGYLALDRATPTLSPGELQRLRLATQLGSQLFGVVYVLDEPSAGLHPADGEALLDALQRLKSAGNSLFVVEHDLAVMRRADWLVDVGPAAGEQGGRVLYSGPPAGLAAVGESQTRRYLFPGGDRDADGAGPGDAAGGARRTARIAKRQRSAGADSAVAVAGASGGAAAAGPADGPAPVAAATETRGAGARPRPSREPAGWLRLEGIERNNLRGLDAAFPLGCLTVVTGVSGSGKSSLASQALLELVAAQLGRPVPVADDEAADALEAGVPAPVGGRIAGGIGPIDRLVQVDQKPIGRTPRSNLATYTGLFDQVRKLFAATPLAKRRGYDAGRFSFNVAKGRCPTCEGEGFVSVELLFLPSVYAPCPACHGARYNAETLEVRWNDRSIADILGLTVDAACEAFAAEPAVLRPLAVLRAIGLGYLRLGQPATELSGGEAQRIKLATELQRSPRGHTLYLLDEPTTGLHPADVDRLMQQLDGLVAAGHTVVAVEHDMRVAARADWVIDVGPGAGAAGGRIVAAGAPARVAVAQGSRTAAYLAPHLA